MSEDEPYTCWASHGEDITAKVKAERERLKNGTPVLKAAASKIVVKCNEGHENVFEV